ncbi:MAG: hypothetical protein ACLUD0_05785 [Eubacterium ramulus]
MNEDGSAITETEKPVISNVTVTQTGELDAGEQMGVGFLQRFPMNPVQMTLVSAKDL